mgnify:FL=1
MKCKLLRPLIKSSSRACVILILMFGAQNTIAQSVSSPEKHLKAFVDEMILIVKNTDMPSSAKQREQLLYDKAMDNFDFITFSRLSLGRKF